MATNGELTMIRKKAGVVTKLREEVHSKWRGMVYGHFTTKDVLQVVKNGSRHGGGCPSC